MITLDSTEKGVVKVAAQIIGFICVLTFVGHFFGWLFAYIIFFGAMLSGIILGTVAGRRMFFSTRIKSFSIICGIMAGLICAAIIIKVGSLLPGVDDKILSIRQFIDDSE